ncbi:hypothetical protein CYMTET_26212 [Cymbomonas tetramitiformis]|uniref:Uncharacterized protein n=1 Tax=Cymbomonas tetramitiformis TaxID=36881 RepID=A0AAE0FT08_9CHLO|nr:hypothetical protein CYMTET_26212 [Cymbomonas tetramitiformis]
MGTSTVASFSWNNLAGLLPIGAWTTTSENNSSTSAGETPQSVVLAADEERRAFIAKHVCTGTLCHISVEGVLAKGLTVGATTARSGKVAAAAKADRAQDETPEQGAAAMGFRLSVGPPPVHDVGLPPAGRPLDGVDHGQQPSALSITQHDDEDFIDWPAFRETTWIPSLNPSANSSD